MKNIISRRKLKMVVRGATEERGKEDVWWKTRDVAKRRGTYCPYTPWLHSVMCSKNLFLTPDAGPYTEFNCRRKAIDS